MNRFYKTYTYFLAALILCTCAILSSCKKKLDLSPQSQISNDDFWKSETHANLALTAVYRGGIQQSLAANADVEFQVSDWWSYHGLLFLDLATDNMYDRRGDNTDLNKLTNGSLVATNAYILNYWTSAYNRIARCNYFIENIDRVPTTNETKTRMKSEARFIRAAMYFYLSQFWGSVPIAEKTFQVDESNRVKKSSKADVINFAIKELKELAPSLPRYKDLAANERGRATQQAALAFLGRLYLSEKKYAEAATTYKQIIDYSDNIIDPNYKSLFNGTNESSREIIFGTQYQEDLLANGILLHVLPRSVGGYHFCNPLSSMMEAYEFVDGSPFSFSDSRYNPNDIGAGRDPRLGYSIYYNQNMITEASKPVRYITHPDSTSSNDQLTQSKQATRTGFGFRKTVPQTLPAGLPNSGIDLPIIRYAEILLSYLEARLENADPIDQALLDATINMVRGRASVKMPPVTETDRDKLSKILRNERRVELAFEGIRLWDLFRWGTAADVLTGNFYGAPFPKAKNLRKTGSIIDPHSRWFVTAKVFRRGVDETWPIPQREIDINPNLK